MGGAGRARRGVPSPRLRPCPEPGAELFGAAALWGCGVPGCSRRGCARGLPGKRGKGERGLGDPPVWGLRGHAWLASSGAAGSEGEARCFTSLPRGTKGFPFAERGKKIEDPLHTHAEATRCCCGWGKVCVLHPAAETWRELRGELRLGGRGRETERSGSPATFPALGSKAEVVPEPRTRLWLLAEQMVCLQGGTGTRRVLVGLMMCLWGCPAMGLL